MSFILYTVLDLCQQSIPDYRLYILFFFTMYGVSLTSFALFSMMMWLLAISFTHYDCMKPRRCGWRLWDAGSISRLPLDVFVCTCIVQCRHYYLLVVGRYPSSKSYYYRPCVTTTTRFELFLTPSIAKCLHLGSGETIGTL